MTKYKVEASSGAFVYISKNTKSSVPIGKLTKGTQFYGEQTPNTPWVQIKKGISNISSKYINKYTLIIEGSKGILSTIQDPIGPKPPTTTTKTESKTNTSGQTINTAPDGTTSTQPEPNPFFLDDSFTISYMVNNPTEDEYQTKLEGLKITDMRGVLGMPHQFLPNADARINSNSKGPGTNDSIGRVYADKIIKQIPLLLITPGVPCFMSSFSNDQKSTAITNLLGGNNSFDLSSLVNENSGKYYSLKYAYTSYFYYVNAMLRSAAYFLGIQDRRINNKKLGTFNWLYHTTNPDGINEDIFGCEGLSKFLGPYAGCIAFYADCGNDVDDSFSNSTTQSSLASTLNSISDEGREINFLLGSAGSATGLNVTAFTGQEYLTDNIDNLQDTVDGLLGKGNIFDSILSKAQTLIAGGRMVFPEIWSDSSFSRSYSCKMKLVSPSGDKLSVYLNILVPIYHLLALVLPREATNQAYYSPFLIRAYSKGLFNVDMGIITDLSITKGAEGEWTVDGIPTVAEVSFTIKDLYEGLYMSQAKIESDSGIMSNITELDYIANSCGININDHEIGRTIKMYFALNFGGKIKDSIQIGIFGRMSQYFNQKINNIFGVF